MVRLLVATGLIASVTAAQAEAWTCSYLLEGIKEPFLSRFRVSPSELIETKHNDRLRLLQNNRYGLVATNAVSAIEEGQTKATVGANIVVINKETGEFLSHTAITGPGAAIWRDLNLQAVKGKCIKD
jgi:hypothetical protein